MAVLRVLTAPSNACRERCLLDTTGTAQILRRRECCGCSRRLPPACRNKRHFKRLLQIQRSSSCAAAQMLFCVKDAV
jgi:hypothetical protein